MNCTVNLIAAHVDKILGNVALYFPADSKPDITDLIVNDGFDELDKEGAVNFYADKAWKDVLEHLRGLKDDPIFGAAYYLEEWSVLSRDALGYYIRAYLEFLYEQWSSRNPDGMFVWFFMGQLYQMAYMHKGSPFSPEQTAFLRRVAQAAAEDSKDPERYGDYGIEIQRSANQFLAQLG